MPSFRTRPSGSLTDAVRRLVASSGQSGLSAMQEMQVDGAVADVTHKTALAEKVRQEVQASLRAEQRRTDPAAHAQFASHSAGINVDDGDRLMAHIRGTLEQPSQADIDDADRIGGEARPFRTAAPVIEPGQDRRFRSALAASAANLLATGTTNADQLTQAAGNVQAQGVAEAVQAAIARGDYHGASAMNQGAKPGTQIRLHDNIGNTGATFAPATGKVAADPAADLSNRLLPATLAESAAEVQQRNAAAEASRAAAEKSRREGKEGPAFKDVTTLRKEFNDQKEVQAYRDIIPIVESARTTPDTRAGDIQIAYAVGKILDPASVIREGELKLTGDAATVMQKFIGELRTITLGKGRMTPETRKELLAMLDTAADQREKTYLATEATYRGIARQNGFPEDQVIINAPKREKKNQPAGDIQARKLIGNVEFVKINGQWYQP